MYVLKPLAIHTYRNGGHAYLNINFEFPSPGKKKNTKLLTSEIFFTFDNRVLFNRAEILIGFNSIYCVNESMNESENSLRYQIFLLKASDL